MPSVDLRPRPRHPKDKSNRPLKPMPFDIAMRKFKKSVERAGIIQEVRRREYFEKPAQKRIRKKAEGKARWRKKEQSMALKPQRRGSMY
jgi:small subunit ribosomal protein S21